MLVIFAISTVFLTIMCIQDFRFRAISWFLFPLLFLLLAYRGVHYLGMYSFLKTAGVNVLILFIQFGIVYGYFSIKTRSYKFVNKIIGLGDILFFIIMATSFSVINFILFEIVSLAIILVSYILLKKTNLIKKKLIPLAGQLAALMILVLFLHDVLKIYNFYSDLLVLGLV